MLCKIDEKVENFGKNWSNLDISTDLVFYVCTLIGKHFYILHIKLILSISEILAFDLRDDRIQIVPNCLFKKVLDLRVFWIMIYWLIRSKKMNQTNQILRKTSYWNRVFVWILKKHWVKTKILISLIKLTFFQIIDALTSTTIDDLYGYSLKWIELKNISV